MGKMPILVLFMRPAPVWRQIRGDGTRSSYLAAPLESRAEALRAGVLAAVSPPGTMRMPRLRQPFAQPNRHQIAISPSCPGIYIAGAACLKQIHRYTGCVLAGYSIRVLYRAMSM